MTFDVSTMMNDKYRPTSVASRRHSTPCQKKEADMEAILEKLGNSSPDLRKSPEVIRE